MVHRHSLLTNVGSTVYRVEADGSRLPVPYLSSNANEGDVRVWLHCIHAAGRNELIVSPDTDVYHIGLTVPFDRENSSIITQLSKPSQQESKYIDMNSLINAIDNDPDLHQVPHSMRRQAVQSLYIASGCDYVSYFCGLGKASFLSCMFQHATCDYVSYFCGLGKASFLSCMFQHATFIAEGKDPPGSIGEVSLYIEDYIHF